MSRAHRYDTPTPIRRRLIKGCGAGQSDIEAAFKAFLPLVEVDSIQLELCLDDQDVPVVRAIIHFMVDPGSRRIVRIPQSEVPYPQGHPDGHAGTAGLPLIEEWVSDAV